MSQKPVQLIPMLCVRCQAPIHAKPDETAWVCEQCGQGQLLDDVRGLRAQDVFFSKDIAGGTKGRPFWVTRGMVTVTRRETYKGDSSLEMREFWEAPRLFFIAAYQTSLDDIISTGVSMLRAPLAIQPGSPVPFLPVVILPDDVHALAEFMVVSVEAERRDALKRINFTLDIDPPQLWIL